MLTRSLLPAVATLSTAGVAPASGVGTRLTCVVALCACVAACGSRAGAGGASDESSDTQAEAATNSQGPSSDTTEGESESTDSFETGEEGPPPDPMCSAQTFDHSVDCDTDCPIVLDVKVKCEDDAFGDPGLRVAPSGDTGALLVTSSSNFSWMMQVEADGALVATQLPPEFKRRTLSLALDPQGEPHLAVDATEFANGSYPGGLTFISRSGQNFIEDIVFDRDDKYIPLFDLEFDESGQAHIWYSDDPPDDRTHATRIEPGDWTREAAPVPGDSGWQRFTNTSTGAPVAFDFDDPGGSWSLHALHLGQSKQIGSGWGSSYPGAHLTITPPIMPSLDAPGPDYFVFKEHNNDARIAWPTMAGYGEIFVQDTGPVDYQCQNVGTGEPGGCPETCEESGSGLNERLTTIARTSDGRVWATWVITHFDQSLEFTESCSIEAGCYCNRTVVREDSWSELVVAQVDPDAETVSEVLRLEDVDPDFFGLFLDYRESPRILDSRAFGNDLSIGLRVRTDEQYTPEIRVLRIDTSAIP